MKKKSIKIKFVDFWPTFDKKDNFITRVLSERYEIEFSDEPEYLFYSCMGEEYLKYDCIRIFYTGENLRPDFNICDYAIGFDYIEFEDRYLRFPQFMLHEYDKDLESVINKQSQQVVSKDKKFCNFIYSNSATSCPRGEFFEQLCKYKKVDSGGKYLNNIDYVVDDKFEWQTNYKFTIAFENSSTNGYVTEKIFQAFSAGTIPIYWGNPRIAEDFNEKAFINCHAYNSFDEVIEKVRELDQNEEAYLEMLNQPVFNQKALDSYVKKEYLADFLYHIVDQDMIKAKRIQHDFIWTQRAECIVKNSLRFNYIQSRYNKKNIFVKIIVRLLMGKNWRGQKEWC